MEAAPDLQRKTTLPWPSRPTWKQGALYKGDVGVGDLAGETALHEIGAQRRRRRACHEAHESVAEHILLVTTLRTPLPLWRWRPLPSTPL